MSIVMINGHVACLKTTLGYLLAPVLQLGHVTTSVLGDFVSDDTVPAFQELREVRYRAATSITRQFLHEGASVILDGTFARRLWREAVYNLANQFRVQDVVAITCVCSDPAIVEQRLAYRRLALDAPDAAANHWAAYAGSVKEFEPIEIDRLPDGRPISHLVFDSASFAIRREVILTPYAEVVAEAIEKLITYGRLSHPQFGLVQAESTHTLPADRLIALEGLGGSGKSTQGKRLAELLIRRGRRTHLMGEFSPGAVGHYLRERSAIGDDHRVRVTESKPSHTELLLVLGDSISQARMACAGRLQGAPLYDVIIADGYIWSHLAHGLALLPDAAEPELRRSIWAVLVEIVAPLRALANVQETVFLKISPELAAERVERRIGTKISSESWRFIERLFGFYEEIMGSGSATIIDASLPSEEVTQKIVIALNL